MKDIEIISVMGKKLEIPVGRHLYGILGTYSDLEHFKKTLKTAVYEDEKPYPLPISVTSCLLNAFSDEEFHRIVTDEAKRPEPTRKSIAAEFNSFIRKTITDQKLIVLEDLELLFAYGIDLYPFRTQATDDKRIILLLPGLRKNGVIYLYSEKSTLIPLQNEVILPSNLIAEDHLWELTP